MTCERPWSQIPRIDAYQRAAQSRGCCELISRHLGRSGAVDSAPEGARRKRGTTHKKQGGLEILRNPRHCGSAGDDDYAHWRAERPTLRGNPAAELGGWKMGCSTPATTSSMCGRCSILHSTQFGLILASWLLDAVTVPPFCVAGLLVTVANALFRAFMLLFLAQLLYGPWRAHPSRGKWRSRGQHVLARWSSPGLTICLTPIPSRTRCT